VEQIARAIRHKQSETQVNILNRRTRDHASLSLQRTVWIVQVKEHGKSQRSGSVNTITFPLNQGLAVFSRFCGQINGRYPVETTINEIVIVLTRLCPRALDQAEMLARGLIVERLLLQN
jgi:hypothetical protein